MSKIIFKPLKGLQDRQYEIAKDILSCIDIKYFIIRASRQSGKSYVIERLAVTFSNMKPNQIGAIIMATNSQAVKIFRNMLKTIPKMLIKKSANSDGDRYIEFTNGTMLMFFSSGSYDSVAGNSFDFMLCDEFGLWNNRAWSIIKPTVAAKKNAKVIIASTPRGKNQFYDVCVEAMGDNHMYKHYRMSWKDNKYYDEREVTDAKRTMPEQIYKQEYEAEFIFGNSSVFGLISEIQLLDSYKEYDDKDEYYFGLDWAGDGEDVTVLTIINNEGDTVLIEEFNEGNHVKLVDMIYPIINKYKAKGLSEYNGIGKGGTDLLMSKCNGVNKWWTSNESKQQLVTCILDNIANKTIKIPSLSLCPKLDNEMSMYCASRTSTGQIRYSHPKDMHDDYVDSLMMAYMARSKYRYDSSSIIDIDEVDWDDSTDIYNYD